MWVVLFHLNTVERFHPTSYQRLVDVGWLGVIVFFVVSGLGIQIATQRVRSVGVYAWHRVWRIYPPYLASLLMIIAFVFVRKISSGINDLIMLPQGIGGWLANIFLATRPVTGYAAVNWVYWSLGYEVAFYLLLGFSVAIKALKWPVLIAVSLAACLFGAHPPHAVFFLRYWSFFALGATLAEWRAKRGLLPILLLSLCVVDFVRNQSIPMALAAVATALSCWACMIPAGAWLNRERIFRCAGQWSYSLYLIHVPIGCWVSLRVAAALFGRGIRQQSLAQHLLVDAACLFTSCAAAMIFWAVIERPSIAMMRVELAWPFLLRAESAGNRKL